MKILYAVHHFPPRYTGGAEWRAFRTASAMQALGHQVQVVSVERIDAPPARGLTWEDEVFEGVKVRRLSFNLAASPDPVLWEYDNPWIGDHLRGWMESDPPDVFHLIGGYLISGSVLQQAHQLGIPAVLTLTDFWFLCKRISMLRSNGEISTLPIDPVTCARCLGEEQRRYRLPGQVAPVLMDKFWRLQKQRIDQVERRLQFLLSTLNRVDAIISPSRFLRDLYIEAGVAEDRIRFSRQGRDFPHLLPEHLEKTASKTLRVGYIGQIAWHKGVHVLFEALSHLPGANVQVKAYGDETPFPKYTAQLKRMAAADPRLELAGVYRRQEVSQVLKNVDVLVIPSVWYENSPNVILEAFAHHTPVIASNLGGMAELVRHGENGLLFETGSAHSLGDQLRKLVDEPGLLASLRAGMGPVRTSAEEMDELEAIYRSVTRQPEITTQGALK